MSKKNKADQNGYVYSTDPGFQFQNNTGGNETLAPAMQKLRIILETKHRAGKTVTVVYGFEGKEEDLEELGKKLKTACGTGGSTKDREIILQGDQREKALQWLLKNGYGKTKKV